MGGLDVVVPESGWMGDISFMLLFDSGSLGVLTMLVGGIGVGVC